MMGPSDAIPGFRNRYREEEYFDLNVRNGVMRSPLGTRMMAFPEDFILGLHRGLEDETGAAAPIVLYSVGRWWGARFVRRQAQEVRAFFDVEMGEMPASLYLLVLRRVWALYGWGKIDLSFDLQEQGFVRVDIDRSIYSETVGNIGKPSEFLVAGILASTVGEMAGRELECVQVACKSKGDRRCTFLVGMKNRVESIQQWVEQGLGPSDILARVEQGEAS